MAPCLELLDALLLLLDQCILSVLFCGRLCRSLVVLFGRLGKLVAIRLQLRFQMVNVLTELLHHFFGLV